MKTVRNILTVSIAIIAVLTAASAVFSYLALSTEFDHVLYYFNAGSVNAALGMYLPVAAMVTALVCALLIRRKVSFGALPPANLPTVFASALSGLLLIVSTVFSFLLSDGAEPSKLSVSAAVFAIIAAVYFLLLPFAEDKLVMIPLSFAPCIWAALKLLEEYFRSGEPINSPIRVVNLTMLAFLLLFFAEEIRFFIDRQSPAIYYFCALSALTFTGAAAFPKLALILADVSGFDFSVLDWFLYIALFFFVLARMTALPSVSTEYVAEVDASDGDDDDAEVEAKTDSDGEDAASISDDTVTDESSEDEDK